MCASSTEDAGRRGRSGGFTLIEVLVAFTIMAIALAALLQAFATGLRSGQAAGERARLVARAESRLASVGASIPLAPGLYDGSTEAGRWEVEVRPYSPAGRPESAAAGAAPAGFAPYAVTVVVTAKDGTRQRLETLRLGPAP